MGNGIPKHIAIIMDGNGRWAKQRGLGRTAGHRQGAKRVREIIEHAHKLGVSHITFYAFSTENWKRPQEEIDEIMNLLRSYLDEAEKYKDENARIVILGNRDALPPDLRVRVWRVEKETESRVGMTINIALNYGGREEIVRAAKRLAAQAVLGSIEAEQIDEELFSQNLYTAGQPDPDLIIRPSGEMRLSNFLLWQCAYSELVFMDVLWPDFTAHHLDEAIAVYNGRQRRFGGV